LWSNFGTIEGENWLPDNPREFPSCPQIESDVTFTSFQSKLAGLGEKRACALKSGRRLGLFDGLATLNLLVEFSAPAVPPDRRDEQVGILERLRRGDRVNHCDIVRLRNDGTRIDVSLTISPVKDPADRVVGASKVARDISERNRAEEAPKEAELSARLLQAQDEERRRIARELHDGVGQLLAAIGMNVAQVVREKDKLSPAAARSAEDMRHSIERASAEIRTVSYLLHPPLLDEVGLPTALRWYADGFAERSKLKVTVELTDDFPRLTQDYELSLFRIAQECLTNIHRHSGSLTAFIRLACEGGKIELEIRDEGKGVNQETQAKLDSGASVGVGFRGMQERVRLIDGKIRVRSNSNGNGTSVLVTLPLNEEALAVMGDPEPLS
jgi:signal transduction histidine kinase